MHVADRAVVDPLDRLEVAAARGGAAGRRRPSGSSRRPACWSPASERKPGASTQHGLLHEDVLAGLDGGRVVDRAEAGRRGQEHQVDAGGDRLLVGVEADEDAVGAARRPWRPCTSSFCSFGRQPLALSSKASAMAIELDVFARLEAVVGGAGAAAAAADQARS